MKFIVGISFACTQLAAIQTQTGMDVPTQLSALLGRGIKQFRITDEKPPRISVIDVAVAVTAHGANYASEAVRILCRSYPEVHEKIVDFKFPGKGQRKTPIIDIQGAVELVLLLPGRYAAQVRRQAAELLCRWLGGDLSIIDEVCAIRGLQEQLAARAPEDPRRMFAEAIEASSSPSSSQLARALSNMNERLANQELTLAKQGQLLARIRESVESDRQRVNLNVRAPKRAGAFNPRSTMDLSEVERPFPVAKFLDLKEREDPSWKCARRSFAPTFGMQVQVLKKQKLKEQGRPAVFVEQNHRAQLLYTDEDKPLMEEAWELTAAHREDLVGTHGNPQDAPVEIDRPRRKTVMDLLQNSRG